MNQTLLGLTDADLLFLTETLEPGGERGRMLRVLREDEEILRAMLADERLVQRIMKDPQTPVRMSPRLLFSVLLNRVRKDLAERSYTFETGHSIVFDAPRVATLLEDVRIADYLTELLVSFVRVQGTTVTVRGRRGSWRRFRFNDLDLMGLIRYTATMDEAQRFPWYKRIGDLCLFLTGVFPEHLAASARKESQALAREATITNGRNFYRAAAGHPDATRLGAAEVLQRLSEAFDLAAKPLAHMTATYLGPLRDGLFAP
jgi:hypothetical protein